MEWVMNMKRSCFSCWIPRNGLSCNLRWPMDVLLVCANQKENTIRSNIGTSSMAPQQLPSEARKASEPGALRLWYLSILSTVPFSQLPEVADVPYSGQAEKLILPKLVSPRLAPRVWNPAAWFSPLQPSTAWDQLRRSQQPNASTFPVACGGLRLADSPHIVAHWQRTNSDC